MSYSNPESLEFHVNNFDQQTVVFHSFAEAVASAVGCSIARGIPWFIDVIAWDLDAAKAWSGDDVEADYKRDPGASVFERIEINAKSLGMIP